MSDFWMIRLKAAYDAGYYRTEQDAEAQEGFPWRDKRCGDCPFWMNDVCQVTLVRCSSEDLPCLYYQPAEYALAKHLIADRLRAGGKRWWTSN